MTRASGGTLHACTSSKGVAPAGSGSKVLASREGAVDQTAMGASALEAEATEAAESVAPPPAYALATAAPPSPEDSLRSLTDAAVSWWFSTRSQSLDNALEACPGFVISQ